MRTIPARFKLHGHTIKVVLVEDLEENAECYGRWYENRLKIELQDPATTDTAKSVMLQTFWHEAVHAILDLNGYGDLSSDEELVDRISQSIYQILMTKKGKPTGE